MDALYDAILDAATLKQVRRTTYNGQLEVLTGRLSGAVDPSAKFLKKAEPRATFETEDISGCLTAISVSAGLYISSGTITIPWNRRANGGTFAGGSNNAILSATKALAILSSISASQGDDGAVASVELAFLSSDGLTAPVSASVNQALSSQSSNAWFSMGPVYIDSSQLTQVKSVRVDPGVQMVTKMFDGAIYPTIAFIQARNPAIEVQFENFDALNAQTPLLAALTSCAAYFRKRAAGAGAFVSDATSGHVKLSLGTGVKVMQSAEGSGQENGTVTLRLEGLALSSSTSSAIP